MNNPDFLFQLVEKKDLTKNQAVSLMEKFLTGEISPVLCASVLTALRIKGESVEEIVGFITAMRKHMVSVSTRGIVLDTCGTGGDGSGTFNISTAVAFVVAGTGVQVAKHGNRNASSLCGSADVLEAMGVNINLDADSARHCLEETGIVFLFAPLFHPAMKYIGPVRKELKIRTVFNFLGPFANPAGVKRQIIGVPSLPLAEKLAHVAAELSYEYVLIVTGDGGLDEISLKGESHLFHVKGNKIMQETFDPSSLHLSHAASDIKGGDAHTNAQIIRSVLGGVKGAQRDIVVLNAAFALVVAGKARNVKDGLVLASQSIDSGEALKCLENLRHVSSSLPKNSI